MTDQADEIAAITGEEPCERCDDSGYVELASGGIWTGENITTRQEICTCICGDDVRRGVATNLTPTLPAR